MNLHTLSREENPVIKPGGEQVRQLHNLNLALVLVENSAAIELHLQSDYTSNDVEEFYSLLVRVMLENKRRRKQAK